MRRLTEKTVLVGVPAANADRGDGFSNANIGYINEFGSPANNIPARPHMVPGVRAISGKIVKHMLAGARAAIDGKADGVESAFHRVGLDAVSSIRAQITATLSPPLADSTLYSRQHRTSPPPTKGTKPLIDTSAYLKSITYVIRAKDD